MIWLILTFGCRSSEKPEQDTSDNQSSIETGQTEETGDTATDIPLEPAGCDGVPGSDSEYNACGVCGPIDESLESCLTQRTLGYIVPADYSSSQDIYSCNQAEDSTSTIWFPCNRDPNLLLDSSDNPVYCPQSGSELNWGEGYWNEFPASTLPVTPDVACQTIFGTVKMALQVPNQNHEYPDFVHAVTSIDIRAEEIPNETPDWYTGDDDCPLYACVTTVETSETEEDQPSFEWCSENQPPVDPPAQCNTDPTAVSEPISGYDWTIADWRTPPANSGFFGKEINEEIGVQWVDVELSWGQLHMHPDFTSTGAAPFSNTQPAEVNSGLSFDSDGTANDRTMDILAEELASNDPFWLRIYTAEVNWAPDWIQEPENCGPLPTFNDYDGEWLPIWEECVWRHMMNMYTYVLGDCTVTNGQTSGTCPKTQGPNGWVDIPIEGLNLKADPRLLGIYVPGAFRYSEYGIGPIDEAANQFDQAGFFQLEDTYRDWFRGTATMSEETGQYGFIQGMVDLVGEEYAHKLIFTGEDFPYSIPSFDDRELDPDDQIPGGERDRWNETIMNHLPMEATAAGMSIRNGITENHSTHHYHTPAYGTFVDWSGHVVADNSWYEGQNRVFATEQECFAIAGSCSGSLEFDDPAVRDEFEYSVVRSNLVSLQSRMNYMYVKPTVIAEMPEHWNWVRHNLSQLPEQSTEAWATLGHYREKFFERDKLSLEWYGSHDWIGRPWITNTEKFLVQRDVCNGGQTQVGTENRTYNWLDIEDEKMWNIEGRQTDRSNNQDFIYLDVESGFTTSTVDYELVVTYVDVGTATWSIEYPQSDCLISSETVQNTNTGEVMSVRFTLEQPSFTDSLPGGTDIRIYNGGQSDIEVRMLRLIKQPVSE